MYNDVVISRDLAVTLSGILSSVVNLVTLLQVQDQGLYIRAP